MSSNLVNLAYGHRCLQPTPTFIFLKKKLSDCFNRWNNNQRTDNARNQLDSDVAMDKFDQLNGAAHNTKGVLLIWNMLLYPLFISMIYLLYIMMIYIYFVYTEWRSWASIERTTWSTNGWFLCTHSFWCFAVSNIEFNTYSWINYLRFGSSVSYFESSKCYYFFVYCLIATLSWFNNYWNKYYWSIFVRIVLL